MKAYLIVGNNIELSNIKDLSSSFVVGVDKGAFIALKKGIKLDLAIGDFDSVNEEEFACLFGSVNNIVKLNPIKDVTDTYEAYKHVREYDEIVILGGSFGLPGLQASAIAESAKKSISSSLTIPFKEVGMPTSIESCLTASIAAFLYSS